MAKAICVQCAMEFPSNEEFQKHKGSGHTIKGSPLIDPKLPPTMNPTPEFIEAIQRIEGKKVEVPPVVKNEAPVAPQGVTEAIKLTYKYVGNCPTHNIPVETFELDAGGKHFVISVCPTDKKQLETQEVAKL